MRKNGKKALSLLLALCMVLGMLPGAAFAAEEDFTIENGVLTKYTGTGGDVVIPEGVNSIGEMAFYDCVDLTSVTIPDSVTSIGMSAFSGCEGLKSVTIPVGVTSIEEFVFRGCSNLASVTIPNSVKTIVDHAFVDCAGLTKVTIPESVESIGEETFSYCGLTSVTIPGSVQTFGSSVFTGCTSLTSVTIQEGVTSIGKGMFAGCSNLENVVIPTSVKEIESYVFDGCSALKHVYYAGTADEWKAIYTAGDSDDPLSNATIHYNFSDSTFQVNFDANGGSLDGSNTATTGEGGMLSSLPEPTRGGYTFDGWYTEETGGEQVTTETVFHADTTVYAHWTADQYTVTFDANGGTLDSSDTATTGDGGKLSSLPEPTRGGYTFDGWYTEETGGEQVTTETVFYADATVYAQWTAGQYTITFEANGGTLDAFESSLAVTVGQPYGALPVPTRGGYTFDGWYTEKEGGGQVTAEHVVNLTGNQTLYAHWTAIHYTVTFDANGGTLDGSNTATTGESGKLFSLPTPTRGGYAFDGWYTDKTGGEQVTTETVFYADATVYAQWTAAQYTVTFDANGGALDGSNTATTGEGGKLSSLPEPTRGGYTFDGWYTEETGGEQVTTETVFYADATVYAQWTANGGKEPVSGTCGDNLTWTLQDGVLTISGNGQMYDYEDSKKVPWYEHQYDIKHVMIQPGVTSIGKYAFFWYGNLTSVTIPKSVTSIGVGAFFGCSGLTSVTIPEGVTAIGEVAFSDCSGLTSVVIPEGVTSIGEGAFSDCTSLKSVSIPNCVTSIEKVFSRCSNLESVTILEGATSIGSFMFSGCTSLKSVTIPEGVTSIGAEAFEDCTGLTDVTIPEGVTSIEANAFRNCTSLQSMIIPEGVASIGYAAFNGCTNLTSTTIPASVTTMGEFVFGLCTSLQRVTIQEGATLIGEGAFRGCVSLTGVTIPESVISIGGYAFDECTGLASVTIPASVTTIGEAAFSGCTSLQNVTIPEGVTSIETLTFGGCTGLQSVTIPKSVTSIKRNAFNGCVGLSGITIPEGVESIESGAFSNCTGLTSVTIPKSVTSIEANAFGCCTGLTSVTIPEGMTSVWSTFPSCPNLESVTIWEGVTSINAYLFSGCSVKSVSIPASVTSIGEHAFASCGLTSVTIPEGVTAIGEYAFSGCSGLTSVTIPKGVTAIERRTFERCTGLTSMTIPAGITSIGEDAFRGCTGLTSVTIPEGVTSIGNNAFAECTDLQSVTIQEGVIAIGEYAFSGCKHLTSVTIPASVTAIGESAFSYCTGLQSVTIQEGVTAIGYHAFSGCTGLQSMSIPASVTSIGRYAFYNCTGLTSVTIPGSATVVEDNAFSGCTGLQSVAISSGVANVANVFNGCTGLERVTILEGVTSIKSYMFSGCTGLKSVSIPTSVTSIGEMAFYRCQNLGSVDIPAGVTSIGNEAFYNCTSLQSVTIPESVTTIGYRVFNNCTDLSSVDIPGSVTSIGNEAFENCTGLQSVTIQEGVTAIGYNAFSGCTGLTGITIPSSITSIESQAFSGCTGLQSVTIPESVTTLGGSAFENCTGLQSVTIPGSISSIGAQAFSGCTGLTSVAIAYGATSIGYCTFQNCTGLTSVAIPASMIMIVDGAFSGCNELRDVYYAGTEEQWGDIGISDQNDPLINATIHYNDQSHASYMVTFHANGGTVSLPGMTVVSAQPYGALPTPVRKGHTFVGWFTQAVGGSQVTAETTVDLTENQTLYAHWTQDKRPTFEALTYGDIDNSRAAFGYPDGYRIPLERYISVFGDNVMARRAYELAGEWNGSCYGMSATSALFFQGDGGITPDSFRSGAANPAALELTDKSEALDLTLLAFIEQLQVSQYASVIQAYSNSTRNDYSGLAAAVRAFQETGEDPVVIVDATHAHTLVGYELQEAGGETRLMVYDCSAPAEAKYLVLSKNEAENYTSCFYGGGNIEVYYIPYAAFYQVWSDHTGTVEVPMDLLDINVPNAEIYDADGTLAAQLKDGALETQRTDIYELTHAGAAGSSRTGSAIWVPAGRQYVVKNTDTAVKTLEVTMVSMEQSVSVTTGGSQVVLAVDDAKASNFVKVENPEAPGTDTGYTVTMESTLTQQPTVVTVSGNLGTSAAPEVRQEGGTLSVTNTGSIGQDTTVKVNEQEITQAELKDGSTLDLDQLMRSPITATLQANGTVELSRAPYGVRYVFAASYEAGRMTGMVQGTLQGKTVTFQGPVSKGFQLFFLDGSYAPLCDKVAVG